MTMSGGLRADSSQQVYSEDVVTYADPATAREWDGGEGYGAIGLVSKVAGQSDDESDEESEYETDEEKEVRGGAQKETATTKTTTRLPRRTSTNPDDAAAVYPRMPRRARLFQLLFTFCFHHNLRGGAVMFAWI